MTDKSEPCFTERARTCLFITRISFKENVFSNFVSYPLSENSPVNIKTISPKPNLKESIVIVKPICFLGIYHSPIKLSLNNIYNILWGNLLTRRTPHNLVFHKTPLPGSQRYRGVSGSTLCS